MAKISLMFPQKFGPEELSEVQYDSAVVTQFMSMEYARAFDTHVADIKAEKGIKGRVSRLPPFVIESAISRTKLTTTAQHAWLWGSVSVRQDAPQIIDDAWRSFLSARDELLVRSAGGESIDHVEKVLLGRPDFLAHNRARDALTGRLSFTHEYIPRA